MRGERRRSRWGELAGQLGLLGLSIYLTLLALAVVGPQVLPARLFAHGTGLPPEVMIPDPELGYRLQPGYHGTFDGRTGTPVRMDTNADGWRDHEFSPAGSPRHPRILVLGDSIAMGVGVPVEDRFSNQLERRLPGSEVDNASVYGYELSQLVPLAERMLPRTRPDLVLYALCLNDIRVADVQDLQRTQQRTRRNQVRAALELRSLSSLIRNVVTLRREAQPSRTQMRPAEAGAFRRWDDPAQRAAFDARLGQLQALCGRSGARLAVLVFPYTFQFDRAPEDPLRAPQRYTEAMLDARDIPYLDLFDPLRAPQDPVFLTGDNCHPNAAGNHLVAEVLADWLQRSRLIRPRPAGTSTPAAAFGGS